MQNYLTASEGEGLGLVESCLVEVAFLVEVLSLAPFRVEEAFLEVFSLVVAYP
jgi:hypothetical protein